VVAFHNNTEGRGLSIAWYEPRGHESGATEDPGVLGFPNPVRQPAATPVFGSPDNFVLLTDRARRADFASRFNTVVQAGDVTNRHHPNGESADDGSLSVALRGADYVNVEARVKQYHGAADRFFVENLAMGNEVLDRMHVPHDCPATAVPDAAPVHRTQSSRPSTG
jgi:hypothetical protein